MSKEISKKPPEITNPNRVKTTRHENGKVKSKIPYVNGKKHGVETEWFTDGSKWFERMWVSGKRHGDTTYWYKNGGKRWDGYYLGRKQHGMDITWREDGSKSRGKTCKNDKNHGLDTSWWASGNKSIQTMRLGGKEHGVETRWDKSGMKVEEVYCIRDEVYARIEWDEKGGMKRLSFPPYNPATNQEIVTPTPITPTFAHALSPTLLNK